MQNLRRYVRATPLRRRHLASLRLRAERGLVPLLRRAGDVRRPRILAYHAVGTKSWGDNDLDPQRFREQLECALAAGHRFVPARDIARGAGQPGDLAVTFDDGVRSVADNAAPVLAELGIPWTLFVVSGWAAGGAGAWADGVLLDWRSIETLAAGGVTIGSHSVTHKNMAGLPPDEVRYELAESRRQIEGRLGIVVDEFAIPMGQARDWSAFAAAAAAEAGYTTVYAQAERRRFPGTVPRTFITRWDSVRVFRAVLAGAFDDWEEWL
jgi:peptidoglycan/xylan/chitin deacetylase (PgdA/CDA1 family)